MMIPVNDMFYSIQGEGMLAGTPMIFVRLHGCPVKCPFCDTKETWEHGNLFKQTSDENLFGKNPNWMNMETIDIANKAKDLWDKSTDTDERTPKMDRWVVLTGGEPCIHNLFDLVFDLHMMGFKVSLETSGTFSLQNTAGQFNWICVSPKMINPVLHSVLGTVLREADEIKMVVGSLKHVNQLHSLLELHEPLKDGVIISLQPMSQSKVATEICLEMCKKYGWNLSIQIHQYLEIE